MSGRIEKEISAANAMNRKLESLPQIFSDYYFYLDARDRTYTTKRNYINHVVEFATFLHKKTIPEEFYKDVTDRDIEKYMMSLRTKVINGKEVSLGDDIRAAKWSSLNTFFHFLYQKRYIDDNPMTRTERPSVRTEHSVTYMTKEEIESVFERINKESTPMYKNRDICIIALGLATGLRVSAIVSINVEDIDFEKDTINVIEKGRKTRKIQFGNTLHSMLLLWLDDRKRKYGADPDSGALFLSRAKERISDDSVGHILKKYTNHLNKHITPHKMRSTAAMNLISAGCDILTVSSILGHENLATTQRYVKALDESKKEAAGILDSLI